jgi:hypothetical protein
LPDIDLLFVIADALEGEPPDDTEWRDILTGLVDKIIVEGKPATVRVIWKESFAPLFELTNEDEA